MGLATFLSDQLFNWDPPVWPIRTSILQCTILINSPCFKYVYTLFKNKREVATSVFKTLMTSDDQSKPPMIMDSQDSRYISVFPPLARSVELKI